MRKLVLSLLSASALAIGSAASAQTIITPGAPLTPGSNPETSFLVSTPGDVPVTPAYTGDISATIGHTGIDQGTFVDEFLFTIGSAGMGQIGAGSGSVITSATVFLGIADLDLTSVFFNNGVSDFMATLVLRDAAGNPCDTRGVGTCGISEGWALSGVSIFGGNLNTLTVSGLSRGNGSYGGNLTFTPQAVPEPATWAMMLFGFGAVGWQIRRQRRRTSGLTQLA